MPSLSHLNPTKQLCLCDARKCNTIVDENGIHGVLLDRAVYSRHQKAERSRMLKEQRQNRINAAELAKQDPDIYGALSKQAEVLAAREQEIAEALSGLSIQDHYPPLVEESLSPAEHPFTPQSKYRIQRERDMANYFSKLEADAHAHILRIRVFEMPPASHRSDEDIQNALQACSNAKGFIITTRQRLVWTDKGHHRRDPLVRYQREEIRQTLSELEDLAQKVDSMWVKFLDERNDEIAKMKMKSGSEYNSAHHFEPILQDSFSIVQIIVFMVVVGHVILGYSQRACRWLFGMCEFIIQTTVMAADPKNKMSQYFEHLFKVFPRDVRTATNQFKLEAKATIYAVCTACDSIYEPTVVDKIPNYPERCKHHIYGSQCGKLLVRPKVIQKRKIFVPIKTFVSFDFHNWMGDLLSRQDYESKMDAAWSRMAPSETDHLSDIFQGSRILEFKGPDGKHFSETGDKNTGRYLFSLGFDFFNPLRNLTAGKKISIGVLALICLNLPIELRYKPENVFLAGIIPGPKEPSLDAVNPYLKPLVDVFLTFWAGVFFTKTFLHKTMGRLVICALLLLICDLPAARKAAGFSACNHEFFCSVCWCTKTAYGYNNFDWKSWKWRTDAECREHARKYRTATSKKHACSLFDLSGIRNSELHRLPYFDATKSVVVDPMHNLFLGLIKEHFQNILGYGKAKKDLPDVPAPTIDIEICPSNQNPLPQKKNEKASVRRLITWLKKPIDFDPTSEAAINDAASRWGKTGKAHIAALVYVLKGVGCIPLTITAQGRDSANRNSKKLTNLDLARKLVEWRVTQVETDPTELSKQLGKVFTAEEMAELVRDIENMVKPSWVTSIPTTISSNGPKLKSDQWRIAGQLYLPVTLIRLWSTPDDEESGHLDLLHLTMSLFSAINVATSRITSGKNADQYLSLMVTYREELKRLFPNYQCHPNHHMALHIPEFIKAYGPVHGWWTFPFERMIGTLQRIPTNYHVGEYEETLARTWYRRSNLRALFHKQTCPKAIRLCREMFDKLVNPLTRNSLANVIFQDQEEEGYFDTEVKEENFVKLSKPAHSAFREKFNINVQQSVHPLTGYHANGVYYTTHSVHEGNSGVFFRESGVPFRIEEILQFRETVRGESVWIVARSHLDAQVNSDPYAKYPHLRAKMWGTSLAKSVEVFPLSAIDSHFAKCVVPWKGKEVAVCVSLSRSQLE